MVVRRALRRLKASVGPAAGILHRIFEQQADARPLNTAVVFGDIELTYGELDRRANRLARHLRYRGVRPGSAVAVLLPRSPDAYAAILSILKAGCAYVPIDPKYPAERISFMLENSGAAGLITTAELAWQFAAFTGAVISVDEERTSIAIRTSARLSADEVRVDPRDACYIIYTSGSTGRPKGVVVEHRSASFLVNAEAGLFGVRPDDRVYQGASLSFDLSVEEMWLAFRAGAALVAATPAMDHAGPDLGHLLAQSRVSVLSTVPTLLSMLAEDVPTVRLLILGGEVCPEELVARWARPGRSIFNTYGPTETTVTATAAELAAGMPVTIGRPLPGVCVQILDEELRPVPAGEAGEICIGGPGVARGYVGLPEETRARFVTDPTAPAGAPRRLYRSGDRGRLDASGNIEFLGRADGQVKVRGFRIELEEIESVILQSGAARAAACAVRRDAAGLEQIVAYVVAPDRRPLDEEALRAFLRGRLPFYMLPAVVERIDKLPHLPSGKLDRSALPAPRGRPGSRDEAREEASAKLWTPTERRLYAVWRTLSGKRAIDREDDFFTSLGGHSLLAARLVSELRKEPRFQAVSVAHVYRHPTIASLAAFLDEASAPAADVPAADVAAAPPAPPQDSLRERLQRFAAGTAQAAALYVVYGFQALQWMTPFLSFSLLTLGGVPPASAALWSLASAAAVIPASILFAAAAKWALLGRVKAGRHRLWSWYHVRWWFVQAIVSSLPLGYLQGTPLLPFVYRLFGARIGRDVVLLTDNLCAFDLISVGDGTSVDDDASLRGSGVEDGELVVGPVTVGCRCFIGSRSVLSEGTVMEDGARLEDLSLLPAGMRIPAGETWAGSPARRAREHDVPRGTPPKRTKAARVLTTALYAMLVPLLPVSLLAAFLPGVAFLTLLDPLRHPLLYLGAAPLVGASFTVLLSLEVVGLKWLFAGRVRPGCYPVHGSFYVRNWVVDRLLRLALEYMGQLHATVYLAPLYRALGSRLGRFVELSTATQSTPDLLEIADGGTVADEVSLGTPRVEGGWMIVAPTRLGRRAFVGNSSVVPAGADIGDGSLVGVLSLCPPQPAEARLPGAAWLGSPPIRLPHRELSAGYSEERTYEPPRGLRRARAAFELLRVTLPSAGFILVSATVITAARLLWSVAGPAVSLALLPGVYAACCAGAALAAAGAKWITVGRLRSFAKPLWSFFVWRLELANALYEFLAAPLALEALRGTPFLPWYLRLLGVRIGRGACVNTTGFLEFDLTEVGDGACLNEDSVLQTHLFEDRVLKASALRIGSGCCVGEGSVVLYDSDLRPGARLDALSLVMKGERIPPDTAWAGIPALWRASRTLRMAGDPARATQDGVAAYGGADAAQDGRAVGSSGAA